MKRTLTLALFSLSAIALFGCPVWSGDHSSGGQCNFGPCGGNAQCATDTDCPSGDFCSSNQVCLPSNDASTSTCSTPTDCPTGQNCGTDGQCHAGDCSSTGCPSGYACTLSNGVAQCVANNPVPDSGPPDAAPDANNFSGCTSDPACADAGAGYVCLDGQCVAPANQCFDATQCPNSEQCVQGVCTPSCSGTQPCPTGYSCDTSKGVCTGNPTPCGTMACTGNTTCVDQHCVAPCGPGSTCAAGLICVDNGCIPSQKPQFICNVEGQQDACASGSICLHHNCYIACSPDAGNACATAAQFNICKPVTTSTGTYDVCGSNSNLGGQCDPTQGKNCNSPQICIDGYCR